MRFIVFKCVTSITTIFLITVMYGTLISKVCGVNGKGCEANIRIRRDDKAETGQGEQMFLKHYEEMKHRTLCKSPKPVIIKVDESHPHVLRNYFPSCTIIHRCHHDSGCCPKGMKCAHSNTEMVTLHFKAAIRSAESTTIAKHEYTTLSFVNHTACGCIKSD